MHQLRLSNTEFEGNNSTYLLGVEGSSPVTLVDTGVSTPAVRADLERRLSDQGVAVSDLDQILLTHWHHDHAGLAGELQQESGATVFVHEADAPLIRQNPEAIDQLQRRQYEALDEWGLPERPKAELRSFLEHHSGLRGDPASVRTLTDGDAIDVGEFDVRVVHLPGHAAGLVGYTFERDGTKEAFLGDVVLPKYTPNIGGADIRVDRPLDSYLESLGRVIDLELDRGWPGHRVPLIDPSGRAAEIIGHHEARTARVVQTLDGAEPLTPWQVSAELFGSLKDIHILHGPGEAYAHLEHLREGGLVQRTADRYSLVGEPTIAEAIATLSVTGTRTL